MTEAEWLKRADPILHFEHDRGWPSARKQRLFAVACCRRLEHLLADKRWGDAIEIAERYADRRRKEGGAIPRSRRAGHRTEPSPDARYRAGPVVWGIRPVGV